MKQLTLQQIKDIYGIPFLRVRKWIKSGYIKSNEYTVIMIIQTFKYMINKKAIERNFYNRNRVNEKDKQYIIWDKKLSKIYSGAKKKYEIKKYKVHRNSHFYNYLGHGIGINHKSSRYSGIKINQY